MNLTLTLTSSLLVGVVILWWCPGSVDSACICDPAQNLTICTFATSVLEIEELPTSCRNKTVSLVYSGSGCLKHAKRYFPSLEKVKYFEGSAHFCDCWCPQNLLVERCTCEPATLAPSSPTKATTVHPPSPTIKSNMALIAGIVSGGSALIIICLSLALYIAKKRGLVFNNGRVPLVSTEGEEE